MISLGRALIVIGIVLLLLGVILNYSGYLPFLRLGRLPGDISIKRGNVSFYLPLMTCLLISLLLTFILYLFRK